MSHSGCRREPKPWTGWIVLLKKPVPGTFAAECNAADNADTRTVNFTPEELQEFAVDAVTEMQEQWQARRRDDSIRKNTELNLWMHTVGLPQEELASANGRHLWNRDRWGRGKDPNIMGKISCS